MAELVLEKRKILIDGKNRRWKRIPETRDSWEETVTKTADAEVGKSNAPLMR